MQRRRNQHGNGKERVAVKRIEAPVGQSPLRTGPADKTEDNGRMKRPYHSSGFVIVRLSNEVPLPPDECDSLASAANELRLPALREVLDEFDISISSHLIRGTEQKQVLELERAAAKTQLPPLRSLTAYWKLDARDRPRRNEELVGRLNELHEVDLAYLESAASDPAVTAVDDPYNVDQDYQDAAPTGVDARWAWTQPNGEGAGVGLIDLEQGWFPGHEDFASKAPTIIYGDNRDGVGTYKGNHGTAVLGEVIADDNTTGVVGIAPSSGSVRMASHYDAGTDTSGNVADAILAAIPLMPAGDVLLLEIQKGFLPTETDDADFDAIRLAVAHGIVVVEAAGNGDSDLDAYTNAVGENVLDRTSVDFLESGAIMIGASESLAPHDRWAFSNFGSRIDCYAWGENVVSCGYGDLDSGTGDNSTYTDTFQGTSSASPIVTGAAMILQGMYEATTGTRLSPIQMRTLLSDPATGTVQGGGVAGNIGVMPNLRSIIEDTLGLVPDVYLRDSVADVGTVPFTGGISSSPDIIARPTLVADPDAAFGQGSGTENSNTLGYEVEAGQDNFIYVRVKNRGASDADDVTATVYWSEVATLVTPDMWTLVGTTPPVDVPQGDTLVVANPITWASTDIPATGHYCFVGVLDHPGDPAPPLPGPTDWAGFEGLIRNQNNVTWRNFNVVDLDPAGGGDPGVIPFVIAGAPDRARNFDFEILQKLPRGARVTLEVPLALGKQLIGDRRWKFHVNRKKGSVAFELPTAPRLHLPGIRLRKQARIKARFTIEDAREWVRIGNGITIRQSFECQEVGRVTWQFHRREKGEDQKC